MVLFGSHDFEGTCLELALVSCRLEAKVGAECNGVERLEDFWNEVCFRVRLKGWNGRISVDSPG